MNFNSKRTVTDEQNERNKRLLANILKEEGNKSCADCKTRNPTWASVNLGVFVCLTCSGIHRSLGVHISQVRSCNLDTWLPKQVEFCRVMGNVKGNRYWEARLPKDFRRPPSGNPNPELASFIRAKYVDRAFAATDAQPPTIDNYLNHPYGADASDAVHSPPAAPATETPAPAAATAARLEALNGTPTKAPAPVTVDLLGGFEDLTVATMPTSPPSAPASTDPFGSFISAPPPLAPLAPQVQAAALPAHSHLNALEWTDFHAAAPPASASSPALAQLLAPSGLSAGSLLGPQVQPTGTATATAAAAGGLSHQRSHSISEGVNAALGTVSMTSQPSRLGGHSKALSTTQPELESRVQSHQTAGNYHSTSMHQLGHHARGTNASAGAGQNGGAGYDPDDLLAGLTIHHVMESMAVQSGPGSGGTAALATPPAAQAAAASSSADPFQFSSSASSHGEAMPHVRGSQHKRHPSNLKATEEILRLFDTAPSTGAAAGVGNSSSGLLGSAPAAADDPFGDFIGGAMHSAQNGGTHVQHSQPQMMRQAQVVPNGLSGGIVANLL